MNREKKSISRKEKANQTRTRLFRCAHDLLREKDFDDITIREIVEAAGVSTGTFYLYFSSKLDVYYQTYEIADKYFEEEVAPTLTQPQAKARILAFFDCYATYNTQVSGLRLTKLLYNSDNKYFNRQSDSGMMSILCNLVEKGMDSDELSSTQSVTEIADTLMVAVRGLVYHWCSCDGKYDLNQRMEKFVSFLLKGL